MQLMRKVPRRPTLPGTYVMVYRIRAAIDDLIVGQLGTFNFPAGYYLYIGSAFGPGGVKCRTDRHLTADTVKRWNIDYLKPFGEPVAVWWTTDPVKWECRWAELVRQLPGGSVPAPEFGARDCRKCAAHLYRFVRWPSFPVFTKMVAERLDGHGPVFLSQSTGIGSAEVGEAGHA